MFNYRGSFFFLKYRGWDVFVSMEDVRTYVCIRERACTRESMTERGRASEGKGARVRARARARAKERLLSRARERESEREKNWKRRRQRERARERATARGREEYASNVRYTRTSAAYTCKYNRSLLQMSPTKETYIW